MRTRGINEVLQVTFGTDMGNPDRRALSQYRQSAAQTDLPHSTHAREPPKDGERLDDILLQPQER